MERSQIQLKTECIKNVPLNTYDKFCFIVNGEKFVTTRLVSDLLSPYISNIHMNDPTFDEFIINTKEKGHFSTILDLTNFNVNDLPTSEIPFISEVLEKLCNQSIELIIDQNNIELTNDNIFKYIKIHEKNKIFYSKFYFEEVKFISTHFYELCCKEKEKMKELDYETLKDIINNESLLINDEDQLISFINEICNDNFEYNDFYEYVNFTFVSVEEINKFIDKFDIDKMTEETWRSITKRLKHQVSIENDEIISTNKRYTKRKSSKTFHYETDKKFNGILNHIRSNYEIENEINITVSSYQNGYEPQNVVLFEDQSKQFYTNNTPNSWICFDFKKRRVIPSHYTLMAHYYGQNGDHPKSWVIEGKNDNDKDNWEVIDEQKDSNYLNGSYYVHTFEINKEIKKEYQYIRMRLTGPSCSNCHEIKLAAFEFYGELIN